jgi:hypothetical protein
MYHDVMTDRSDQRRKLDAQASSAHELMLELMDFAAAQAKDSIGAAAAMAGCPTCQTCTSDTRQCVRGLYFKGLRRDIDDEMELERLRGQGCHVRIVDASRLEAVAPELLGAVRRAIAR